MTDAQKREMDELRSLFSVELPEETRRVSTGIISVDLATGGGFPEGVFSEVSGEWQTGKSLICYQALRECQRAGGLAILDDAERAFTVKWARTLGITSKKNFIYYKSTSLEDGFVHLEGISKMAREMSKYKDKPILYVKDSLEASIAKEEADRDFDKPGVAIRARVISRCLRRITNLIADQRIAVVFVNQLRTNVGVMFGPSEESGGGRAPKFYAGLRCVVKKHGKILSELKVQGQKGMSKVLGQKGILEVIKSKVGIPFKRANFEIIFGSGIAPDSGLLQYLLDEGVVTRPTNQSYAFAGIKFRAKDLPDVWEENEHEIRLALASVDEKESPEEATESANNEIEKTERPRKSKIRKKIS